MSSLLALCRYRDTREEFIQVLFGGVTPEPEPSSRISIAPTILFSTGTCSSSLVCCLFRDMSLFPCSAAPRLSVDRRVATKWEGGERVYKPQDVDLQHPSDNVRLFLSLHSHQSHSTQLNSLSFAFTRHRSSDTMVAFKLATLLAVATAVAAYPGGLLTRSGTCSTGTLNCCNSIQVRTSFLTLKLFFCSYSCPPQTACWLRQLCRLGRASPN